MSCPDFQVSGVKRVLSRRDFLGCGAAMLLAATSVIRPAHASQTPTLAPDRKIRLYNPRTKEQFDSLYCVDGCYIPEKLEELSYIMRDCRTGDVKPIDPKLLDLVHAIYTKLQPSVPFHVISGYRSPATNAMLRKRNRGVARNSFHLHGQAADLRLPGWKLRTVRKTALNMRKGGVGYYPRSNFIHLDVGPIRTW